MAKVLIISAPGTLSVVRGTVVGTEHQYVRVRLDHYCGEVWCLPRELELDTVALWLPVWARVSLAKVRRFWRRYHERKHISQAA